MIMRNIIHFANVLAGKSRPPSGRFWGSRIGMYHFALKAQEEEEEGEEGGEKATQSNGSQRMRAVL